VLGVCAAREGDPTTALTLLNRVGQRDPNSFLALYWLSRLFRERGNPNEALEAGRRAAMQRQQDPEALNQLGLCMIDLGMWNHAEACLLRAVKVAPHLAAGHLNLGIVFERTGRFDEAKREYKRAIAVDPYHLEALLQFGQLLVQQIDYLGAAGCAERVLSIDPDSVQGHLLSSLALVGLNQPQKAADHAVRAVQLDPLDAQALRLSGEILQSIGRIEEAKERLVRSIEIEPQQGFAYYALVRGYRVTERDKLLIDKMKSVVAEPNLSPTHRGEIEFALGKAYADLGEFGVSMEHYDSGNRIFHNQRTGGGVFDSQRFEQGVDFVIENVTAKTIETSRGVGSDSELPIFVVGMIRSGTTLAEQILSCHPEVGAAGEQTFWLANAMSALDPPGNVVNGSRIRRLEQDYLTLLKQIGPDKSRVVDKMPGNFSNLGLIHIAFPNARIVHIRRNPIDTCLSIWMTPNRAMLDWASEKKDIVFAYRQYLRVMDHWRAILPADRLLEIQYEDLVANQEAVSKQMIEFCGLDWNEACLRPERNDRAVATPSAWQVRQPVYRDAVERWRRFEPYLGEFSELGTES